MQAAIDNKALLTRVTLGALELANRVVMAPMTRNRADEQGVPTPSMVQHYRDRATAGLIIAEGSWPCRAGQAYCRQPGIETPEQIAGWRQVTDAVHDACGRIVLQLMHAGRIGSHWIKGPDTDHLAPSAICANGEIFTDAAGMQPFDMPRALSTDEVWQQIAVFRQAARNARQAGFDGVELHCTSGYLPMQFLCDGTNQRTDEFGGTAQNRARFAAQCLIALCDELGPGRVGVRLNPGNCYNDTADTDPEASHRALLEQIAALPLAYVHVMRSPLPTLDAIALVRELWHGPVILNDNYQPDSAGQAIAGGQGDAVSFARHFIANPDLVARIAASRALANFDRRTLYTPGDKGYNDYPNCDSASIGATELA
ncbi:alkene reductase [Shewanella sp. GXUN23E]|uniref:alkene reductase n=1 Tax=Shewanella sp. GXUN23E TaxID=3422498 RepID=UPI003D7DA366